MVTRPDTERRRNAILRCIARGGTPTQAANTVDISVPAVSRHLKVMGLGNMDHEERQRAARRLLGPKAVKKDIETQAVQRRARQPSYLAPAYPAPPKGCRYYVAKKRRICGKLKARGNKNYCENCMALVSPQAQL